MKGIVLIALFFIIVYLEYKWFMKVKKEIEK